MEHFYLKIDSQTLAEKTASVCNAEVLEDDTESMNGKGRSVPLVEPTTPWLGYDHDNSNKQDYPVQLKFDEYPRVRGWTMDQMWSTGILNQAHSSLSSDHLDPKPVSRQVVAMLQSWLFFGLLESILGKRIRTSYFLCDDETGTTYIHSENLVFALLGWQIQTWKRSDSEIDVVLNRAYENLRSASGIIQQLFFWTDSGTEPGDRTREKFPDFAELVVRIVPSIIRLMDVVGTAKDQIHAFSGDRIISYDGLLDCKREREHRLVTRGWCPFLIRYCETSMYYSVLDWLDGSKNVSTASGHENCTSVECKRNNIDITTYQTLHWTESCRCQFVKPDLKSVLEIIDRDEIPVVEVMDSEPLRLKVKAQPPNEAGNYLAVSHVWVDGLGSTTEIGMPECQVRRLGKLARIASESSECVLWMDSLCIPAAETQRKKSIRRLRDVYRNAEKVLVIDKTIRECPNDTDVETLLWSIISSPWM